MDALNPLQLDADRSERYKVVADPRETQVMADDRYAGIICTGDVLNLAPPPGEDPQGSLLAAVHDDAASVYDEGPESVLDAVQSLDVESLYDQARDRYEAFFADVDAPFHYISGNQDIPDALHDAAGTHDDVHHASSLPAVYGVDGWVPTFADLPSGTFPGERDERAFTDKLAAADDPMLVAHTLPEGGYEQYGFVAVIGSGRDIEAVQKTGRGVQLPSYRKTEESIDLILPVE